MRCIQKPLLFYIAWRRDVACYVLLAAFRVLERGDDAKRLYDRTTEPAGGCALRGQPRACPERSRMGGCPYVKLSLLDRYVVIWVIRAQVVGTGADQAVVIELLDYVRGPATDAGDGEDRRKQVHVDAEGVIGGSGIKVDIGVQLLVGFHEFFDLVRHLKPL